MGRVTASGMKPSASDKTKGVANPGGQRLYSKGRQKEKSVRLKKKRKRPYTRLQGEPPEHKDPGRWVKKTKREDTYDV